MAVNLRASDVRLVSLNPIMDNDVLSDILIKYEVVYINDDGAVVTTVPHETSSFALLNPTQIATITAMRTAMANAIKAQYLDM